jgi:hypothetical protein
MFILHRINMNSVKVYEYQNHISGIWIYDGDVAVMYFTCDTTDVGKLRLFDCTPFSVIFLPKSVVDGPYFTDSSPVLANIREARSST